jgi:hypothetical protein
MLCVGGKKPYEKTWGKDEKHNSDSDKQKPPSAWKIHLITHNDSLALPGTRVVARSAKEIGGHPSS